jgi:Mrp family chromosome partitioning ATPase
VLVTCWSAKGGSGTTTVALTLALVLARRSPHGSLLVDLGGDVPTVAGLREPPGPGVAEWLAGGAAVPADGLARLEAPLGRGVNLIPRGSGALVDERRARVLAEVLAADPRPVVVDAGLVEERHSGGPAPHVGRVLVVSATRSLLVTRACVVALHRAKRLSVRPAGVVLVQGDRRALDRRDVEQLLEAPVVAEVPEDDATARRVDAGLLTARLPRDLERALGRAA